MSHKSKCACLTDSDGTEHYYVEDQEPGDAWRNEELKEE